MSALETLARNLRAALYATNLTAAELSVKAGVGKIEIVRILRLKGNPRLSTLEAVSTALGLQLGDLLSEEGAPICTAAEERMLLSVTPPYHQAALLSLYLRLNRDLRQVLRAFNGARIRWSGSQNRVETG